jgi:hypothetical protein
VRPAHQSSDEIDHGTVVLMIDLPPDELRSGAVADVIEPDRAGLLEQVGVELEVSKAHLRSILDQYRDHDWRRTTATAPASKISSGAPPALSPNSRMHSASPTPDGAGGP